MNVNELTYSMLRQDGDVFTVVTRPLGFPVDALARKAMKCPAEVFDRLPLKEAKQQQQKFERWRQENEAGRKRK